MKTKNRSEVPTQATNFIGLAAASAMGLVYQAGPGGGSAGGFWGVEPRKVPQRLGCLCSRGQ